jgi:hypothetical protein
VGFRAAGASRAGLAFASSGFGSVWVQRQVPAAAAQLAVPACPALGRCIAFAGLAAGGSAIHVRGSLPGSWPISP